MLKVTASYKAVLRYLVTTSKTEFLDLHSNAAEVFSEKKKMYVPMVSVNFSYQVYKHTSVAVSVTHILKSHLKRERDRERKRNKEKRKDRKKEGNKKE
jgi:hypothetical protein